MRVIFLLVSLLILFTSCDKLDNNVIEITGLYDANIIGVTDLFTMSVASNGRDDLLIEAPFDGEVWSVVEVDVDNSEDSIKDLKIPFQRLGPDITIEGTGYYSEGMVQIDYVMNIGPLSIQYKIIGAK